MLSQMHVLHVSKQVSKSTIKEGKQRILWDSYGIFALQLIYLLFFTHLKFQYMHHVWLLLLLLLHFDVVNANKLTSLLPLVLYYKVCREALNCGIALSTTIFSSQHNQTQLFANPYTTLFCSLCIKINVRIKIISIVV